MISVVYIQCRMRWPFVDQTHSSYWTNPILRWLASIECLSAAFIVCKKALLYDNAINMKPLRVDSVSVHAPCSIIHQNQNSPNRTIHNHKGKPFQIILNRFRCYTLLCPCVCVCEFTELRKMRRIIMK